MKFFSSLVVLSLGLFAAASPIPSLDATEIAVRDTDPNTSVVPLTLFALFQTLEEAVVGLTPTLLAIIASSGPAGQLPTSSVVPLLDELTDALNTATAQLSTNAPGDMGANDEDLANLINEILDDVNTALNKLVAKLGLDGLLTPVDAAVSGLLVSLDASLAPSLLAALQPLLVGLGGVVGGLLAGLDLSSL
ncbi:hypothetical protein DFH08DRAFT_1038382 [Mycena albidolilacea]|uniref:Uncharacterized protein n=1 Tax=Mycena albidolilacea TaxID=1033008 RepID=A0AAD7F0V1_9AGAR|nr:hypothetical protein DFH08DRAFT_1038382 [Mycena albidolilacea]